MSRKQQYLQNIYKWKKKKTDDTTFADLTERTMMINMKCCICLALTNTKQKINNSTVDLIV